MELVSIWMRTVGLLVSISDCFDAPGKSRIESFRCFEASSCSTSGGRAPIIQHAPDAGFEEVRIGTTILKRKPQVKLNDSWIGSPNQPSEIGAANLCHDVNKVCVVQSIEHVRPKLYLRCLADPEIFRQ